VVIRLLLLLGTISFGQKSYARSDSFFLFFSEIFPLAREVACNVSADIRCVLPYPAVG